MKPSEARRRAAVIEDHLDLLKDSDAYYESQYFQEAVTSGGVGILRASTHGEYFSRYDHFAETAGFAAKYQNRLTGLPDSNGQRWFQPLPYTIGIICDDFLYSSFEGSIDLLRVTPQNYEEAAERCDMLLVTTTWRGIDKEWLLLGSKGSASWRRLAKEVIPAFRRYNRPIGFYSKEDPPNYVKFRHLAELCDFAFTSAAEMVTKYEKECPNLESVSVLPFSVSALHHNPVGSRILRIPEVLFAGSWFNRKYSTRRSNGLRILTGVDESSRDLVIVDRNSAERRVRYAFPEQFLRSINPAIKHDSLLKLQKATEININLNSVPASDTMFANRAIELQAMGSCLVSSYNKGLNSLFPNVFMPDTAIDTRDLIDSLTDKTLLTAQMAGIRNAWSSNVNFDRVAQICAAAGLDVRRPKHIIGAVGEDRETVERFVAGQILTDPETELRAFGDAAEAGAAGAVAVTTPNPNSTYDPHFVQDLANAFKYVDADTVTAPVDFVGPMENRTEHNYSPTPAPDHASLTWLGGTAPHLVYAVQRGLVGTRTTTSTGRLPSVHPPLLSVIVPIYNNGRHLEHKCLASLRRSSIFEQMELVLVDDGSTDPTTRDVLDRAERDLPNVVVYRNPPGGSGSASRPRNQGLGLATGRYVTYLDPDNEAMNDAYARLVTIVGENATNFAIGNMLKLDTARRVINNIVYLKKVLTRDEDHPNAWHVPDDVLARLEFRPMSIQALVADTAWLKSLGLVQPVGGVGQDSYFFQQMIHYADRISIFEDNVHVYFAGTANSTVNTIGANFFRKYLPLERDRSAWLRETGLLDDYLETRLEQFVGGWFLQKFARVRDDERAAAFHLLDEIISMYVDDHEWKDAKLTTRLENLRQELGQAPDHSTGDGAPTDQHDAVHQGSRS